MKFMLGIVVGLFVMAALIFINPAGLSLLGGAATFIIIMYKKFKKACTATITGYKD